MFPSDPPPQKKIDSRKAVSLIHLTILVFLKGVLPPCAMAGRTEPGEEPRPQG